VQERLTTQIAEAVGSAINPLGVGVVIEARHLCMMMRGVEKQHSSTITSSVLVLSVRKGPGTSFSRLFAQDTARPNLAIRDRFVAIDSIGQRRAFQHASCRSLLSWGDHRLAGSLTI
jgi:GTP cyclohydrolase I-like protein